MSFREDVAKFALQVSQRKELCRLNEEATKQALIVPFLQVLGYDIWNPKELLPEYKAGWASKEKIDYALCIDDKLSIFIEAKAYGERLANYDAQLAKYFNATPELKIAVITDGVTYKFFTDSDQLNIMDKDPLFEFNIEELMPQDYEVLDRLRKSTFDVDSVIVEAENAVYLNGFMKKIRQYFNNPNEDFVKFIAADIYPGRLTSRALERLQPLVKQAIEKTFVAMVSQSLSQSSPEKEEDYPAENESSSSSSDDINAIETTEQELEAYHQIVKILNKEVGEDHGVNYKDTKSYFSIQIGRPSNWFCRLHFNSQRRIYTAFKVSAEKARELLGENIEVEEYNSSSTDGCLVTYHGVSDLITLTPLILESYRNA